MGRLPVVDGRRIIRALRAGFVLDRVVGSHHVLVHPLNPTLTVTVPVHAGRDLMPDTIRAIVRQAGLTVDESAELL